MTTEWKKFDTAPTDREFLVALASGYISRGRFVGLNKAVFATDSNGPTSRYTDTTPLYWAELPELPESLAERGMSEMRYAADDQEML